MGIFTSNRIILSLLVLMVPPAACGFYTPSIVCDDGYTSGDLLLEIDVETSPYVVSWEGDNISALSVAQNMGDDGEDWWKISCPNLYSDVWTSLEQPSATCLSSGLSLGIWPDDYPEDMTMYTNDADIPDNLMNFFASGASLLISVSTYKLEEGECWREEMSELNFTAP